jgi:hypothetical protein
MNEKLMAFAGMDLQKLKPARCSANNTGGRGPIDALVTYSYSRERENDKCSRVRFAFHARAVKQLGWMKGDKLTFAVSKDGAIVVMRDQGGYTLTTQDSSGKSTRFQVQFPIEDAAFLDALGKGTGRNVEIANGAIAFEVGQ